MSKASHHLHLIISNFLLIWSWNKQQKFQLHLETNEHVLAWILHLHYWLKDGFYQASKSWRDFQRTLEKPNDYYFTPFITICCWVSLTPFLIQRGTPVRYHIHEKCGSELYFCNHCWIDGQQHIARILKMIFFSRRETAAGLIFSPENWSSPAGASDRVDSCLEKQTDDESKNPDVALRA